MIAAKQMRLFDSYIDSKQSAGLEAFKRERDILGDLDYPHIVQYLGFEENMTYFTM